MSGVLPISTGVVPMHQATPAIADAKGVVEAFKAELKESAHVTSPGGFEDGGVMQAMKNYVDSSDPNRLNLTAITKAAVSGDPNALNDYSVMTKDRTNKAAFAKIVADGFVNTIKTLGQS